MITFHFPDNFLWGTASAAFHIEGGADADGRGPSIWDAAYARDPSRFRDRVSPAVTADFYHRYLDDVAMMGELGLKSFRFSLSWSRLFPDGVGPRNEAGFAFYDRLIDALLSQGIEPFVDLYHWDLPQALAEKGGFANPDSIAAFQRYAEACFAQYGDRVHLWSTLNEPSVIASGYRNAGPPFLDDGHSGLLAGQHLIRMHYAAIRTFRESGCRGKIGAVIALVPIYPATLSERDAAAARRSQDEITDWWLRPLFDGEYPSSLLDYPRFRDHLPDRYAEELRRDFTPLDFIGINYYNPAVVGYEADSPIEAKLVDNFFAQDDYAFGLYPPGLFDGLRYLKETYHDPEIFVTENGLGQDVTKVDVTALLDDTDRIDYLREHLREVSRAISAGVRVSGYYHWAHIDTYEGLSGYRYRFGLVHLDLDTLQRTRKNSWYYYRDLIKHNRVE